MTTIAPWCSGNDILERMGEDVQVTKLTMEKVDAYALVASEALFNLSGRQFRGLVTRTVQARVGRANRGKAKASLGSWWPVVSVSNVLGVPDVGPPQALASGDWEWNGSIQLVVNGRWAMRRVQADLECGQAPPAAGVLAAKALGVELVANDPDYSGEYDTRLPALTTSISRQGVSQSFATVLDLMKEGATGIQEVDLFVQQYNKIRTTTRPRVRSMR